MSSQTRTSSLLSCFLAFKLEAVSHPVSQRIQSLTGEWHIPAIYNDLRSRSSLSAMVTQMSPLPPLTSFKRAPTIHRLLKSRSPNRSAGVVVRKARRTNQRRSLTPGFPLLPTARHRRAARSASSRTLVTHHRRRWEDQWRSPKSGADQDGRGRCLLGALFRCR